MNKYTFIFTLHCHTYVLYGLHGYLLTVVTLGTDICIMKAIKIIFQVFEDKLPFHSFIHMVFFVNVLALATYN